MGFPAQASGFKWATRSQPPGRVSEGGCLSSWVITVQALATPHLSETRAQSWEEWLKHTGHIPVSSAHVG